MSDPVRVLVVDDSAFMRKVISDLLGSDGSLAVIGTARDGLDALEKAAALQPDVVTLDVEMPRLDGLATLRRLMAEQPRAVVMVSSLTRSGADATVRALALGAVDVVAKPSGAVSLDLHVVRDELVRKVKAAAQVAPRHLRPAGGTAVWEPQPVRRDVKPAVGTGLSRLVVVAASTGGPGALHRLLGPLPSGLPAGLLVVQHMPAGFTRSLAAHLDQSSGLTIREAAAGDRLTDGLALVAPGGHHLTLTAGGGVELSSAPHRHGVRPAADVTLESVPNALVRRCLVVVLTGMGMDGARGARCLKDRGAEVWAQDEASSVVYGMPRAVAELGAADRVGTPEQLAVWIREGCGQG